MVPRQAVSSPSGDLPDDPAVTGTGPAAPAAVTAVTPTAEVGAATATVVGDTVSVQNTGWSPTSEADADAHHTAIDALVADVADAAAAIAANFVTIEALIVDVAALRVAIVANNAAIDAVIVDVAANNTAIDGVIDTLDG